MRRNEASGLDTLAEFDEKEGLFEKARRGYLEAVRIGVELGIMQTVFVGLAGLGRLSAREGLRDAALELAGFGLGHPAAGSECRSRAAQILQTLKASQDDPDVKRAAAAAAAADAFAVARRLLAEAT